MLVLTSSAWAQFSWHQQSNNQGSMKLAEIDSLRQFCSMNTIYCTMEDDLWCKTTFDRRRFWWKKILMEDTLCWKTTFYRRQPLMEDNLWWKVTFDGRQPLMEDNLCWKTTFDGRRPTIEDDLWIEMNLNSFLQKFFFRPIFLLQQHFLLANKLSDKFFFIKLETY